MGPAKKWKVVALRNGVAESLVVEAHFAEIMAAGVLQLMNGDGHGRLDCVHAFAPGHWTEVSPAEVKRESRLVEGPPLEKRNGHVTYVANFVPLNTTPLKGDSHE